MKDMKSLQQLRISKYLQRIRNTCMSLFPCLFVSVHAAYFWEFIL